MVHPWRVIQATGTELTAELHRTARDVVAYGLDRVAPERDIRTSC